MVTIFFILLLSNKNGKNLGGYIFIYTPSQKCQETTNTMFRDALKTPQSSVEKIEEFLKKLEVFSENSSGFLRNTVVFFRTLPGASDKPFHVSNDGSKSFPVTLCQALSVFVSLRMSDVMLIVK